MDSPNSTPKPYWPAHTTLPFSLRLHSVPWAGNAIVTIFPSGKNKSVSINAPLLPRFFIRHSCTPYRVAKNEDSEQNFLGYFLLFFIRWAIDWAKMLDLWFDHFIGLGQNYVCIIPRLKRLLGIGCIDCMVTDEILQLRSLPVIQFTELNTAFSNGERI